MRRGDVRGMSAVGEPVHRGVELFEQPAELGQVPLRPVLERTLKPGATAGARPLEHLASVGGQIEDVCASVSRVDLSTGQPAFHQWLDLAGDRGRVQLECASEYTEPLRTLVRELAQNPVRRAVESNVTVLAGQVDTIATAQKERQLALNVACRV
jgi:hypothetical protein